MFLSPCNFYKSIHISISFFAVSAWTDQNILLKNDRKNNSFISNFITDVLFIHSNKNSTDFPSVLLVGLYRSVKNEADLNIQ
ncbi:hypothetical protein CDG61_03775 [Acinetobacter sp. WCHAc010052]|nr:hypothetical protein CDG61_03775 [Acinetobacter sp. WCHAc010052]